MDDAMLRTVVERFAELSAVPRRSGDEAAARDWVERWARTRGWGCRSDRAGNVVVVVPPPAGRERQPPVVLQGHLDMVCEKEPGSAHDFARDPILPIREGEWLRAKGTTLGADNGIAVAMAMALAERSALPRPPLELLFTVEEETGLRGAAELEGGMVRGRSLVNLDSEALGVLTVGCAGGEDLEIAIEPPRDAASADGAWHLLTLSGASGGHSGVDIHRGRANAVLCLARVLAAAGDGIRLASFDGGTVRNAIPRQAAARLRLPPARSSAMLAAMRGEAERLGREHAESDPGLRLEVEPSAPETRAFTEAGTARLLDLLGALPNGVAGMSAAFPGTVETSNNVGVARSTGGEVLISSSQRSSSARGLAELRRRLVAVAALAGARTADNAGYPPWQPDLASPLLARATAAWRSRHGAAPEVRIIHAGLECAVIGARIPGMDMISLGPTIEGAHSPSERLHLPSVAGVLELVEDTLASFSG